MNGARKGSAFEREICRKLSLWWTQNDKGGPREDVFWRSSQSGGRATIRARQGKTTAGSYGDICALDPVGAPLLEAFTIELKRGKSGGFPGDIIDREKLSKKHPWAQTIAQTRRSKKQARSKSWIIIAKRDGRQIMIYQPWGKLAPLTDELGRYAIIRCHGMKILCAPFEEWIKAMDSSWILEVLSPA